MAQPAPPVRQAVPAPAIAPIDAEAQAPRPGPHQGKAPIPGPSAPVDPVARDNIVATMPRSSSDSDGDAPARQPPAVQQRGKKRRQKQSLGQLVRENQLLYKRWMTKKVPKIMRELGISSSSDDDDDDN